MRDRSHVRLALVVAGQALLASAPADAQVAGTAEPQPTAEQSIVYKPREPAGSNELMSSLLSVRHDFGAPEVTESGGTRGAAPADDAPGAPPALPDVFVLAPPQLAQACRPAHARRYLSGPSRVPVRVTLLDLEAASPEPLVELDLGVVPAAGVYATSLAKQGIRLEPGRRYEWSVALEVNREAYSEEPVAKTIFATAGVTRRCSPKLAGAPPLARIEVLAAAGYWYDALELLAQQIAADDRSQPWRELSARCSSRPGWSRWRRSRAARAVLVEAHHQLEVERQILQVILLGRRDVIRGGAKSRRGSAAGSAASAARRRARR